MLNQNSTSKFENYIKRNYRENYIEREVTNEVFVSGIL